MDPVASQKRSLQQIYAKLNQNGQAFGQAMAAYNRIAGAVLFDPVYYDIFYPDARKSGLEPLAHYILHGAAEGRNSHPLFDGKYYLKQLNTKQKGINGLQHYLDNSKVSGINPCLLFDWEFYLSQVKEEQTGSPLDSYLLNFPGAIENPMPLFDAAYYLAENKDVRASGINPLVHFVLLGGFEGRSPHPLFSTQYYLDRLNVAAFPVFPMNANEDIARVYEHAKTLKPAHPINALVHYMEMGHEERRDPHPLFSSSFYLENHPHISEEPINALLHYVQTGAADGLQPHILFEPDFYAQGLNAEQKDSGLIPKEQLLSHYIKHGARNLVPPHPSFNSTAYLEAYPHLQEFGANPLIHYLTEPAEAEHRVTNEDFDGEFYVRVYSDVEPSGMTPLEHYIRYGKKEERVTNFCMWAKKLGKEVDPRFIANEQSPTAPRTLSNAHPQPVFSILLHGAGDINQLIKCVAALSQQQVKHSFEVLVTNATEEEKRLFDQIGVNVRDRGQNPTEILNRVAREASGSVLVFLKKNMVVANDFFPSLEAFYKGDPKPTIVCPRVMTRLGRNKHIGFKLSDSLELTRHKTYLDAFDDESSEMSAVDAGLRECLVIAKEDFIHLGGFDQQITEEKVQDIEFCLRAKSMHFQILSCPNARVLAQNEYARPSVRLEPFSPSELDSRRNFLQSRKAGAESFSK